VVTLVATAARHGNVNAVTDAGVAGLLAQAAGEGAALNVEINLKSLPDSADKNAVAEDLESARAALLAAAEQCRNTVRSGMSA